MTPKPKFLIGTDLLWNSEDPEDYARLVEKVESNKEFSSEELERFIFQWFPIITDTGSKEYKSRDVDKLRRNLYGVELVGENPPEIYLRGLHFFVKNNNNRYELSDYGENLKTLYENGSQDPLEWKGYLNEIVCRFFVRVRTLLYYIGVQGYQLHWNWSGRTFNGTGKLTQRSVSYPFYIVGGSRNSARTFEGLSKQIDWERYSFNSTMVHRMYDLEAAWFNDDDELAPDIAERVIELRSELRTLVNDKKEYPNEGTLRNILDEMEEVHETASDVSKMQKRFDNALNLLLDANRQEIVGPWNLNSANEVLAEPVDDFEISGRNKKQPKGKQILVVLRRGLKPLVELGILVELDNNVWGIDKDRTKQVFASDLCDNLFTAEFSVERDDVFLEKLEETCFNERMNDQGDVDWSRIRDVLMDKLDIESHSEFGRKMEEHINAGAIEIQGIRKKNAWMEDGPPGYEKYGTVRLRLDF